MHWGGDILRRTMKKPNYYGKKNFVPIEVDSYSIDTEAEKEYNSESTSIVESEHESDVMFIEPDAKHHYYFSSDNEARFSTRSSSCSPTNFQSVSTSESSDVVFIKKTKPAAQETETIPVSTFTFGTGKTFSSFRNPQTPFIQPTFSVHMQDTDTDIDSES